MKLFNSESIVALALIATRVQSFNSSPWSLKAKSPSILRMTSYEEQLQSFYKKDPSPEPANGSVNDKSEAVPETKSTQESAVVQTPVLAPPQPMPVATQTEKSKPLIGAGSIVFLGLPLWLLVSFQIFFGGDSGKVIPPSPAQLTLPASVVTPATTTSAASPAGVVLLSQPITKAEVRGLFDLWNDALQTGDPATVAKRYAKDGVLLPTLSDVPRNDFEAIKDYFVGFLRKKPVGKILEGEIFVGNNWAQDAGIYEFTFQDGSQVKARYSFVYSYEDGKWMISHHHSSLMPEEVVRPVKVTESEVRGFFDLWNDALATGDPQQVAARYSEDAVLLPTLSDSARYTNERIADYFVGFLKKKPSGEILEGNIKIGPNWAQDAGIYEFTFEDGSKTKGRYSYVYTYEKGEWKISNHHSSIMPEPAVAAFKRVAAMEATAAE